MHLKDAKCQNIFSSNLHSGTSRVEVQHNSAITTQSLPNILSNNSRPERFQKTTLYDWNLLIRTIISVYKLILANGPAFDLICTVDMSVFEEIVVKRIYNIPSEITRRSITIDRSFGLFNKSINRILNWTTNTARECHDAITRKIVWKRNHKQQF